MPATPSRIGFITSEVRAVTAGPNTTIETLYGDTARDNVEPLETFFDDTADAQIMANERLALLEVKRSLVSVLIDDTELAAGLDRTSSLPTVRVIDDEQGRNSPALIVGVTIDYNTVRTTLETWG
jgi:hypothetical protein